MERSPAGRGVTIYILKNGPKKASLDIWLKYGAGEHYPINPFGTGGDFTLQDYKGCWMPFRSVRKLPEAVVSFTEP